MSSDEDSNSDHDEGYSHDDLDDAQETASSIYSAQESNESEKSYKSSRSSKSTERESNDLSPASSSSATSTSPSPPTKSSSSSSPIQHSPSSTKVGGKTIRRVDRSDFADTPGDWTANDKPIHSLRCVTSNKQSIYKLPMTKEQNKFADNIFKTYVSRDILGLSEKHADEKELKRIREERKRKRKAALRACFAKPYSECVAFFKRKKKEYKLYRAGFRKVTNKRRRNYFRFCSERQVAKVRQYIKSGHPVDDIDSDGRTGMHHAAAEGHSIVVRELLKRGAEVDSKERLRNATPFWYSALRGDLSTGELLINARCDVDHRDAVNQQTPLMLCAIGNFLAFAERLIDEGAFLTHQDTLGMTPLHHAAFHGFTSMVFLLLEADHEIAGAREMRDYAGNLPLDWAYSQHTKFRRNDHKECAKLLRFGLDNRYMDNEEYLYW